MVKIIIFGGVPRQGGVRQGGGLGGGLGGGCQGGVKKPQKWGGGETGYYINP